MKPGCSHLSWLTHKAAAAANSIDEVQWNWKAVRIQTLADTVMYLLVFLGLLSVAQSGKKKIVKVHLRWAVPDSSVFIDIPQNTQGQWIIPEKNSVYEDPDGLLEEESVWSANPPEYAGLAMQDQKLLTTPEPDAGEEGGLITGVHNC